MREQGVEAEPGKRAEPMTSGASFGERWRVVRSLDPSQGLGHSRVFQVEDRFDGSSGWVLKTLKARGRLDRFARELETLRKLSSPYILPVEDHSLGNPAYFVCPRFGQSLWKQPRFTFESAFGVIDQLAQALTTLHSQGIAHRDLKPANVLFHNGAVRLIDFGLSCHRGELRRDPARRQRIGNPRFAAPECEAGSLTPAGLECDLYSLGKLAHWMVFTRGEHLAPDRVEPIQAPSPPHRALVEELVRNTVQPAPAQRWRIDDVRAWVARGQQSTESGQNPPPIQPAD